MENYDLSSDLNEPKSLLNEISVVKEINYYIDRVNEGYEDELKAFCTLSDIEKAVKNAKDAIIEKALEQRKKYPEKTLEIYGKKISIAQSGRYTYDHYEGYKMQQSKLKEIEDAMKQAYNAGKTGGMIVIDGEVIPPAAYIPSKESLKIG